MNGEAACLGLADIFTDRHHQSKAMTICGGCPLRDECAVEAVQDLWVDDDDGPDPETCFVRGGLLPWEQVALWHESLGGRLRSVVLAAVA